MRILVTGSPGWSDGLLVSATLSEICEQQGLNYEPDQFGNSMPDPRKVTVVHGGCPTGADHFADQWCLGNFFTAEVHPADWARYGRSAGPRRNAEMVRLGADVCLAFIRGNSKGATHCSTLASEAGIQTFYFRED